MADIPDKQKINLLRPSFDNIIYSGIATDAMFAFIGGPLLIAYALMFGAGNITVSLLGNLEFIGVIVYILSAYLLDKGYSVKKTSVISAAVSRLFYLFLALLAFFPKNNFSLTILVLSILTATIFGSLCGGAFYPWMKGLIPQKLMGSLFGKRYRWMTTANLICYIFALVLLKLFERYAPDTIIIAYSILFFLAFFVGEYATYALTKIQDITIEKNNTAPFYKKILSSFKNKFFVILCSFLGIVNFVICFVSPFLTVFLLKQIGLEISTVIFLTLISQLAYIFSSSYWIKQINRDGCLSLLKKGTLLYILFIMLLYTCAYLNKNVVLYVLIIAHLILGSARFAVKLSTNNLPLEVIPKKDAPVYFSVINLFKGASALLAGTTAGICLTFFEQLFNNSYYAWFMFWMIGILLCSITFFFYSFIKERKIC